MTTAGLLLRLGGPADTPTVHADQVAALGRRRDLPALLDRSRPHRATRLATGEAGLLGAV
ncbi:hypothetical protein AB0P15_31210 [Streptomyces sp. NPDC087917]|uniref:hypothetical protein n=1 Tax=Streptomyces sp. NPDC087917 TaxID=3155060 RepID=UPI00344A1E38